MSLDHLLIYVVKNVCQTSLCAFAITGNILFRSMPNGNCLPSSASLSLVGDNSLVHELEVMAAVKLHLNATHTQDPALKSFNEKEKKNNISWVVSYSSHRTVFELVQGL